jgi:hypothetical protein
METPAMLKATCRGCNSPCQGRRLDGTPVATNAKCDAETEVAMTQTNPDMTGNWCHLTTPGGPSVPNCGFSMGN